MISLACNTLHVPFSIHSILPLHFHMGPIVHDMYIYFSAYHFKHFNSFIDFNTFYDNYMSRSEVGGLDSTIYTMSPYFLLLRVRVRVRVRVCVCFFGKGKGGNTPYARTQGEL